MPLNITSLGAEAYKDLCVLTLVQTNKQETKKKILPGRNFKNWSQGTSGEFQILNKTKRSPLFCKQPSCTTSLHLMGLNLRARSGLCIFLPAKKYLVLFADYYFTVDSLPGLGFWIHRDNIFLHLTPPFLALGIISC